MITLKFYTSSQTVTTIFADHHQSTYHCLAAFIGNVDSYAQWGSKKVDFWTFNPNREGFCLLTLSHVRTLLKIGFEVCSPCLQIKLKIIHMSHRDSHTDPLSQWFSKDPHTVVLLILWIPIAYEIVFLWLVLFRIIFFYFYFIQ